MKVIVLTGRLTVDPKYYEKTEEKTGRLIKRCNFAIANNDVSGKPEFFNVVCWNEQAAFVKDRLKKGNGVLIHGTFHQESYDAEDGTKRWNFSVVPNRVEYWG